MSPHSMVRVLTAVLAGLVSFISATTAAHAQAWTPAKGQGSISLSYQFLDVRKHLFSVDLTGQVVSSSGALGSGYEADRGHITAQTTTASVEYGILDRLAATADIAFVQSRYRGVDAEATVDDGSYHGGFQDLTLDVRYAALRDRLVLTPHIVVLLPTSDYPTMGHVAIGTHLRQFHAGLNMGRTLAPFLPDAWAQLDGAFVWSERVGDHNMNHELADLELGYFVTPSFSVRAFGNYLHTLGGIDWANDITGPMTFEAHDRASRVTARSVGGGASLALGQAQTLFVSVSTVVSGANTHKGTGYTLGTSRSFSGLHLPMRGRPTARTS